MKRLRKGEGFIGLCHYKGDRLTVRPMFEHESTPVSVAAASGIEEGDVVRAWSDGGDLFVSLFHRKGTVLHRYMMKLDSLHIDPFFPLDVLEEVKDILDKPGIDDPSLQDFTHLPFVTIDNEDSKDLDQAVYVEKNEAGFIVYYAIADASYYIRPGSALFREALRRGASYYFPDYSVPMLPRELSEGLISLNAGEDRRSLLFIMEIDGHGNSVHTEIVRARIKSRDKLSYNGVQEFYDNSGAGPLSGQEYTESLLNLQEAGKVLAAQGERRGVINYDRFEQTLHIADDEKNLEFQDLERNDASRWNEQASLLCNMEGAKKISAENSDSDLHIQPVFRIHDAPDEASLQRLEKIISEFIELHALDSRVWGWRRGESLAAYLKNLPHDGPERRITEAIQRQVLISNQRSLFSENPGIHYALGVKLYGRFSSPMREIVGIFSHKELAEKLGFQEPLPDEEDIELREKVILASNRCKDVQKSVDRMVNSIVLDSLFGSDLDTEKELRPEHSGTIMGMKDTRIYVMLDSPRIEVKVYTEDIERYSGKKFSYRFHVLEEEGAGNDGVKLRAGDEMKVRVESFDENGKWRFSVPGI
ncbi:MAG TPA: RNB domain-containing ribonuclease [Spirochaetota bacterium]|nr:RNB domain-containing ribonuclease [Spirochaetota bacterium]HPJ35139.1 RNB domain-containing ribonuclease [Spirochaetota bacterium]